MSPLLLLALVFAQHDQVKEWTIGRTAKADYITAIRELERAAELIESEPREAIAKISAVINNSKITRQECRLKIEVQPSIYEKYTFFPYLTRGKANMAAAKRLDPKAALSFHEAAVADIQKSVDAKVGGSADLFKEATTGLEKCRKAIADLDRKDPMAEFRLKFDPEVAAKRFRTAVNLLKTPEGQKLSDEQRAELNTYAEENCQRFVEGKLGEFRSKLGDASVKDLRDTSESGFKRQYADLVPPEAELTETWAKDPTLTWARRHLNTLKSIQANRAKLEDVLAAAAEALATESAEAKDENRWFRAMAVLGSELVEEVISERAKSAEKLAKSKRAGLQAEADKAHAAWKEFLEKTDKKVLERHPDLSARSDTLVEATKGFPVELTQLSSFSIDDCFTKEQPVPELIKLENSLLDLASKLPGRVAIESRQELYEKIINAGTWRRYLQGIDESDVIRDLRRHGEKLKEAGGPANPAYYGPKFKRVFDNL